MPQDDIECIAVVQAISAALLYLSQHAMDDVRADDCTIQPVHSGRGWPSRCRSPAPIGATVRFSAHLIFSFSSTRR